jgi:hypothetical protein
VLTHELIDAGLSRHGLFEPLERTGEHAAKR